MSESSPVYRNSPESVHKTLGQHILADGYSIVLDLEQSKGSYLVDARNGERYLDLASFFGSQPIGYNHPSLNNPEFIQKIGRAALCKPVNSDLYTVAMADFVETFANTAIPESHRSRLFFVEGGALAVENALKAAFDWKFRKNMQKGGPDTEDLKVLHFKNAFHGRSGYTLSLTNTHDPRKYQYFPKFPWPRVAPPVCHFPLDANALADVQGAEKSCLEEIEREFEENKDTIAAIIVETIQAEGGDQHFRKEFLQALRDVCDKHDALLVFDEVQCGMGITGHWWAFQGFGVVPDIFSFGKKSQVCGIAAGPRLDEIDSVFKVSSRINSTWGGNLVDMIRSEKAISIIDEGKLLEKVRAVGAHIIEGLTKIASDCQWIDNVRGRGLMIAFDLPDTAQRNQLRKILFQNKVIMLGCGRKSLRLRPVLDFSVDDANEFFMKLETSLKQFELEIG
ncbi:MAG: L-lysine 6-transaminase [Planctomycetota bacterium]|nr:L-lysine 6-transaminase [Planctomycetota bacterium]